jgi:RNA recognition motif-containing protein
MKKLFVGNLSWKATEELLKEHFEVYGNVVSTKIITDQYTGKSKGFGFVEMESADAAEKAIAGLNDKPMLERNLRVSLAQERTERSDRSDRPYSSDRSGGSDYSSRSGSGSGQKPYNKPRSSGYGRD